MFHALPYCFSAKPSPGLGRSANDCNLYSDTRGGESLRTWYVSITMIVTLRYTDSPLASHRWHIDCFRCNTCGITLDSNANPLLLGDGLLTCNDCTYSCSVCNKKIEDLVILTSDQTFCAICFKCRSCKKKIESLRHARTSQGILCMECHGDLGQTNSNHLRELQHQDDKGLPALPLEATPAALREAIERSEYTPQSLYDLFFLSVRQRRNPQSGSKAVGKRQ